MSGDMEKDKEELKVHLFMMLIQVLMGIASYFLISPLLGIVTVSLSMVWVLSIKNVGSVNQKTKKPKTVEYHEKHAKTATKQTIVLLLLSLLCISFWIITNDLLFGLASAWLMALSGLFATVSVENKVQIVKLEFEAFKLLYEEEKLGKEVEKA